MSKIAAGLEDAFFDRMNNDSELTGYLESYKGRPAIFGSRPTPEDVHGPYIISEGFVSIPTSVPGRSKQKRARDAQKDIMIYTTQGNTLKQTNTTEMEDASERVFELFDRHYFDDSKLNDYESVLTRAVGPENAPTGEDSVGRIVSVTAKISEA